MEKITFDFGVKEYKICNGVLRFNPSDPNVYARMMGAMEKIQQVEESIVAKAKEKQEDEQVTGKAVLQLMEESDREVKKILSDVFGNQNDFDKILGGVNVLAVAGNGERVITNLINALFPILQEGAQKCAREQAGAAVTAAKLNRAQRRAAQRR